MNKAFSSIKDMMTKMTAKTTIHTMDTTKPSAPPSPSAEKTNAAMRAETLPAVKRTASVLISTGNEPFSMEAIRWGLSRLGDDAEREPLDFAAVLIDEML